MKDNRYIKAILEKSLTTKSHEEMIGMVNAALLFINMNDVVSVEIDMGDDRRVLHAIKNYRDTFKNTELAEAKRFIDSLPKKIGNLSSEEAYRIKQGLETDGYLKVRIL